MNNLPPDESPTPYVPPPSEASPREVIPLSWSDPMRWLVLGWRDLTAYPGISLFYGLAFWCMALVLGAVFRAKPEFTMTIASAPESACSMSGVANAVSGISTAGR
jgi:hypothetical protein